MKYLFVLFAFVFCGCPQFSVVHNPIEGSRAVESYSSWYANAWKIYNNPCYYRYVPQWARVEKKKFENGLKIVNRQLGPVVSNRPTYENALKNVLGIPTFWKRGVKNCSLPASIPEGLKSPILYASYYTAIWSVYNKGCYKGGGGAFWRTVSRSQLELANSKAIASLGRLVVRPEYERTLRGFLNNGPA